jgi:hypothetical protein
LLDNIHPWASVLSGGTAVFTYTEVTIDSGATVQVTGSHPLALLSQGDMTIAGTIDANGSLVTAGPGGFAGGTGNMNGEGPGAGFGVDPAAGQGGGGGGGYGGNGGDGGNNGGAGGTTYGNLFAYLIGGSGGGSAGGVGGGGGGGAIELGARGTIYITNSGQILAAGGAGISVTVSGVTRGSGAGAGGGILLHAPTITLAGAADARGGFPAPDSFGGRGGGGRIALEYTSFNNSGALVVSGANDGTITQRIDLPLTGHSVSATATAGQLTSAVVATFTDGDAAPTLSDFSATIDWGDGTVTPGWVVADPNSNGTFDVQGSHGFTSAGLNPVHVTIFDIGASTTADSAIDVTVVPPMAEQTISFDPVANHTYGDAPFSVSATASSGLPVSFVVLSGPATISGNEITILSAGTVVVEASQAGDATYNAAPVVDQSFLVNPAPLTITADNQTKPYGAPLPPLIASYSGFVNGDTAASLTTAPSVSTTATAASAVGSYAINAAGAVDPDYSISYVVGTLTVNKAVTTTAETVSAATPLFGVDSVTFTASVSVNAPGSGSPTGSFDFFDVTTGTDLGIVALSGSTASLSTSALAVGQHSVSANYLGDGNFLSSNGGTALEVIPAASLSGTVFEDFNNDGQIDFGERGIPGVSITLGGTDDLGHPVTRSQLTDSDGAYVFNNVRPGAYTITETQPAGYTQGVDTVGTWAGTPGGSLSGTDQFFIPFSKDDYASLGTAGINYNFGEQPPATGPVQKGQTAGIGFWNNKNSQALIKSLNGGTGTLLADWLAATLPHMYGASAGNNDLAGQSNTTVAALFQSDFVLKGVKLDAQVLATALSVYVTNATLDSTQAAAKYGFTVSGDGVGTATVNVGSNGDAFGVANNTTMTVTDLLLATDAEAVNGGLYNGNTTLRNQANNLYTALNEAGAIS